MEILRQCSDGQGLQHAGSGHLVAISLSLSLIANTDINCQLTVDFSNDIAIIRKIVHLFLDANAFLGQF